MDGEGGARNRAALNGSSGRAATPAQFQHEDLDSPRDALPPTWRSCLMRVRGAARPVRAPEAGALLFAPPEPRSA